MDSRRMLSVITFLGLVFGLIFLIIPEALMTLYDLQTDDVGYLMASFFGASVVGFSILTWLARDFKEPGARRSVFIVLFITSILGTLLSFVGWSYGMGNLVGLIPAVIFLLCGAGSAYYLFFKPGAL